MAKYPYAVKYNGEYYEAGEDVPENEAAGSENSLPFSDDDITLETKEDNRHTKTEIKRMKLAELQELASENEIDGAYDMTGEELKDALVEFYEL
ncbi:MAG: hypothetical protein HFH72_08830 [Lachnospiraceae bacterium]|nr:hypothetical protein [Lachnospiraceae bacterium]